MDNLLDLPHIFLEVTLNLFKSLFCGNDVLNSDSETILMQPVVNK